METSITRRRRKELIVGALLLAAIAVLPLPIHDTYTREPDHHHRAVRRTGPGMEHTWRLLRADLAEPRVVFRRGRLCIDTVADARRHSADPGHVRRRGVGWADGTPGRLAVLSPLRPLLRDRDRRGGRDRLSAGAELGLDRRRHRHQHSVCPLGRGFLVVAAVPHRQAAVSLRGTRLRRSGMAGCLADRGLALGLRVARGKGRSDRGAEPCGAHLPLQDGSGGDQRRTDRHRRRDLCAICRLHRSRTACCMDNCPS